MVDWRRWLRLAEPPVLRPQLELVIDNMRGSFWAGLVLVCLVRLFLSSDGDNTALNLWCAVQVVVVWNIHRFVRHFDRAGELTDAQAQRFVAMVCFNTIAGGLTWGAMFWLLPANADAAQLSLAYALLALVQSGAVTTISPLLPVFLAFQLSSTLVVMQHVGWRAMMDHPAVAFGGLLYVATLVDQAIRGARAARSAIELRIENATLLTRLSAEHEAAKQARGDAERASLAKSRVMAAASHDLRQPVHAQGLFLELLGATDLSQRQRELLTRAREAVGASSSMLGTLFDYSRIEAGVVQPRREAFAVQTLLNRIEREFGPQADARRLTYRSHDSGLMLFSDPALVELVLRNFVSNAIRYTRQGGLLVACRRHGAEATLEVWDTGVGIAAEHHTDVFLEFHQVDNPERDRQKGLGLGLAIVDGLARTLGHHVALCSVPGRGSVFRLRLPLAAADAVPAVTSSNPTTPRLLKAHVLVIDDDETILVGMAELLRSWGCICDLATTVELATELAAQRRPDLLISDYRLRGQRTGLQFIAELKANMGRRVPAVLITGDTTPECLREAAESGIRVLHKPVLPGLLYQELARALVD